VTRDNNDDDDDDYDDDDDNNNNKTENISDPCSTQTRVYTVMGTRCQFAVR
jgi:hypothetical protein